MECPLFHGEVHPGRHVASGVWGARSRVCGGIGCGVMGPGVAALVFQFSCLGLLCSAGAMSAKKNSESKHSVVRTVHIR